MDKGSKNLRSILNLQCQLWEIMRKFMSSEEFMVRLHSNLYSIYEK